jgi:electron transport complex protein RnfG
MLGKSIGKNAAILTIFALVTAGTLAAIFMLTKTRIAEQERQAAAKALLEIVPKNTHDNNMLEDTWPIPAELLSELNLSQSAFIHIAKQADKPVAIILPIVAPDGYSGDIKLLVGIMVESESIAGVRVLSHKETPGLGDKIDLKKSDWILSFDGRSLQQPPHENWAVRKDGGDFDQFTGATITPRAVINQVRSALEFYLRHKKTILGVNGE